MELLALMAPSANRVYGANAPALALAELRHVTQSLPHEASIVEEAGVPYLKLALADSIWEEDASAAIIRQALAFSPHIFAAYEVAGRMPLTADAASGDERCYIDELASVPLLQPLALPRVEHFGTELLTTLKYPGKTNEQFTALMMHLAAHAAGASAKLRNGTLRLLDPVAGRGTTLNQALMWGLSPVGVDIDKKDAELYRGFLTGWMREARVKHTSASTKLTVHSKALGHHFSATLARSKQEQKEGRCQSVDLYTADTTQLGQFLKARSFDVIVADLPYGVQHGSRSQGALKRSPLELLEAALGAWKKVLRGGGAMALAINRHTANFSHVSALLAEHGIDTLNEAGEFRHRVDASIDRDIVLGRVK